MVVTTFKRSLAAFSISLVGIFSIAAQPAMARTAALGVETSGPTADFDDGLDDVGLGIDDSGLDGNGLDNGDAQFSQLFADWEALGGVGTGAAPTAIVSIPSRMPLDNAALTSDYGMRTHPVLGGRRSHKGVDLAASTGTPIFATADGIVSKAGRFSSYGKYVSIEHGAQLQTRFAHMSRIAVNHGDRVKKGDVIGYVGSTGRSTGPHLHYEVRIAGEAVNPIPYMVESEAQLAYAIATGDRNAARGGD
ncbi:MAG: M23 family metallopeptidase [Pontixanthobacter sp.]